MFTLKASQLITHSPSSPTYRRSGLRPSEKEKDRYGFFRPTDEVREAGLRTVGFARALGGAVLLFQCPASFQETTENVRNFNRFFEGAPRDACAFAWEPRGEWSDDTVRGLCRDLRLLHCTDPLVHLPLTGEPWYLRLHGGEGYRHRYSLRELRHLRELLADRRCRVLFNNVSMLDDAQKFAGLIERAR